MLSLKKIKGCEKRMIKKKNYLGNHFGIVNILFLLVLIVVSALIIGKLVDITTAFTEYRKNTAEITNKFSFPNSRGGVLIGVKVKYTVDDKYYEADIKYNKSSWEKGDKINIYYNPYNVTEVVSIDDKMHSILLYSLFEIALIWGTFFYDYYEENLEFKRNWKKSRLYLALVKRKAKK